MGQSDEMEMESSGYVGGRVEPIAEGTVVAVDTTSSYDAGGVTEEVNGSDEPDEDESVSLESKAEGQGDGAEAPVEEDIVYALGVAAATHGREFDGPLFAELLERGGPIEDVRLMIAIAVLRTGQKLNGDRMLRVLESMGFEGEAAAARIARDELSKVLGSVVIESTSVVPGVETVVVTP